MAFPSAIDAFINPLPDDPRNAPSLAAGQQQQNNALVAIETYVGVSGSTVPGTVTKTANDAATAAAAAAAAAGAAQTTANNAAIAAAAASVPGPYLPSDYGLKGWSQDPATIGASAAPTSGTLTLIALKLPAMTVTNVHWLISANNVGTTNCFGALYSPAGNLLSQSANLTANATNAPTDPFKTFPLAAPQVIAAGIYWTAFWITGGSGLALAKGSAFSSGPQGIANLGLAAANARWATANTGLTTTAPATLGTKTGIITCFWAAVS